MRVSETEIDSQISSIGSKFDEGAYPADFTVAIARLLESNPDYWKRFGGYAHAVASILREYGSVPPPDEMDENASLFVLYHHETHARTAIAAILAANESRWRSLDDSFAIETLNGTRLYQWGVGLISHE